MIVANITSLLIQNSTKDDIVVSEIWRRINSLYDGVIFLTSLLIQNKTKDNVVVSEI